MISVIIPVYKTQQYLKECMDSVLRQRGVDLEIILVDDGSPDDCPAMCDAYAEQCENVKAVHKENGGLGLARNAGAEAASGEYLFFLDSDDRLDSAECLSRMYQKAQISGADITVGGFRRFSGSKVSEVNRHHLSGGEYTETEDFRFKGFYMYGHLSYNWGKLYRREFLERNRLKCQAYPFTQDKAYNMRCCACRPVYAFVEDSVYLYRENENSVTYKYKKDFIPVWISIASDFDDFLTERKIQRDYGDLIAFHIFFGSFFLVKQELQFCGRKEAAQRLKEYCEDPFAAQQLQKLARGRYLRGVDSFQWRFVIRIASCLLHLRGYGLLTYGIALLRKWKIDQYITGKRYRKQGKGKRA